MPAALSIGIVIASGVLYHLAQKASGAARPWTLLAVAYGAAFAGTLALALSSSDAARWRPGRVECIGGLALGLAAFGIEAGTFFIYRGGWPLASATVIASVSITAILAVVGITAFGEHLTAARAAGLALAAGAALLIAKG